MASIDPWHFDRRVPVALIVTILMQTAAAIWWASALSQRVSAVEAATANHTVATTDREARIRALELSASRTDERLIAIQSGLSRIERLLEERYQP